MYRWGWKKKEATTLCGWSRSGRHMPGPPCAALLIFDRNFEVEIVFPRRCVFQSGQVEMRAGQVLGQKVEKAEHGITGREKLGGEGPSFDFPNVERPFFLATRQRNRKRIGAQLGRLGDPIDALH